MSKLYFKIGSDWEEVVRLRNEIAKLKQELMMARRLLLLSRL